MMAMIKLVVAFMCMVGTGTTSAQQPKVASVNGAIEFNIAEGKHLGYRIGRGPTHMINEFPSQIEALRANMSSLGSSLSDDISTLNASVERRLIDMQTRMIETLNTELNASRAERDQLADEFSRTVQQLNASIIQLDRMKASADAVQNISDYLNDTIPSIMQRLDRIEGVARHSGQNLVLAADLIDTAGAGWLSTVSESQVVIDTFLDGLPIRAMKSVERGRGCYNWGRTNKFSVDPRKTYEFSIWMKSTRHQSDLDNYFGYFVYRSNGSQINDQTDQEDYRNPYFKTGEKDTSQWVKYYGYLLGMDFQNLGNSSVASLYGLSNGLNTIRRDLKVFRYQHPDADTAILRFGSCYGTGTGAPDDTKFTLPMVREIDLARSFVGESIGHFSNKPSNNNLVRHSNMLRTEVGSQRIPATGGDRWNQPIIPTNREIVIFDGNGVPTPIVAARSQELGHRGCYGGWGQSNFIRVDPTRHYEFSIWIKSNDPTMSNYFGLYVYDQSYNRIGSRFSNPYFKCNRGDGEEWVQYKGYLFPHNYGTQGANHNRCGAYTHGSTNYMASYQFYSNVRYVLLRFGSCYGNGNAEGVTWYANPTVKLMTGR